MSWLVGLSRRKLTRLTDRRTERPWQYRALHYMQLRGKNVTIFIVALILLSNRGTRMVVNTGV